MAGRKRAHRPDARALIAQEAARVMVEGGIKDYRLAKRKAIERLRIPTPKHLPGNDEIEAAIRDHQALFFGEEHEEVLRELRLTAASVMRALSQFKPRLVGPVLAGTADQHSVVNLHLFADPAETLGLYLLERAIAHRPSEHRVRWSSTEHDRLPAYSFEVDGVEVEAVVFSGSFRGRVPLSPVDGKAERRAALADVEALL